MSGQNNQGGDSAFVKAGSWTLGTLGALFLTTSLVFGLREKFGAHVQAQVTPIMASNVISGASSPVPPKPE